MELSFQLILSLLTALGIGGIIGAYFKSLFQHKKELKEHEHELKQKRYLAIIILMLTKLDPITGIPKAQQFRKDLRDENDVQKELEVELMNSVLFASDFVIKSLSSFVRAPNYSSYIKTVVAMRHDLWNKKTSINERDIAIFQDISGVK